MIHELGVGVTGYAVGERVLVGAITPCGHCNYCLSGDWSHCGGPIGGGKFGNTSDGAQAEYLLVPDAQANLAKIVDDLSDEQVVLLADSIFEIIYRRCVPRLGHNQGIGLIAHRQCRLIW